jgi:hypothetical protein
MVIVAVVAICFAAEQTRRRWLHYRRMVYFHAIRERSYRQSIPLAQSIRRGEPFEPKGEDGKPAYVCGNIMRAILESPQRAAYHGRQRRRYEHAVRFPWIAVLPEAAPFRE